MPLIIPILIGLFPFIYIIMLALVQRNKRGIGDTMSGIKFFKYFPIAFYYDPKPEIFRFKKSYEVKDIIEPGDVLLQRNDNYLQSLVLGQTSYFTHAGLYYGDFQGKEKQVIHSTGSKGVDFISLDHFLRCDDIAVLRFDTDLINRTNNDFPDTNYFTERKHTNKLMTEYEIKGIESVEMTETLAEVEPGSAYDCEKKIPKKVEDLIHEERTIHNSKLNDVAQKQSIFLKKLLNDPKINIDSVKKFMPVILDVAAAYQGTEFDYGFNFTNTSRLSCIEFVWVCYKALFPIHRIDREKVCYFNFVNTYVIVPDMFLRSKLFTLKYNSVSVNEIKALTLYKKIKNKRINFWFFYLECISCQILLLVIVFLLFIII